VITMQFDKLTLGRTARELGFVRDTFEKVCRLVEILKYFESDELLADALALKGGTAINLTIFDLPRLSVDIDLDYCKSINREAMLSDREIIASKISKYMKSNEYTLSPKTKHYHALDSFVFEYTNAGTVKDNLKIEINYMLRCHVLPLEKREVKYTFSNEAVKVLSVAPIEIFSSKTVALLSRTAPRDLYELYNMIRFNIIDDDKREMFRKCVVFYSAISSEHPPKEFKIDNIGNVSKMQIKRDLNPVLKKTEQLDLELVQEVIKEFLRAVLIANDNEKMFWNSFKNGIYRPELLFSEDIISIKNHPMALWKCRNNKFWDYS